MSEEGPTPEQREALLVEYQKTQDSAQHHDVLVWSITSLNWIGSALLMGFGKRQYCQYQCEARAESRTTHALCRRNCACLPGLVVGLPDAVCQGCEVPAVQGA